MTQVRKAVITAAGKGTRQYPATNTVQKELFPLVDIDGYAKPTLQIIVEEALASGIDQVCIVANPTNIESMQRHFEKPSQSARAALKGKAWALELADKLADLSDRLTFVVQEKQDGYGHAVLQARQWVGNEPHVLMLGDHVYIGAHERCCRQAVNIYNRYQQPVSTVSILDETVLNRFGTVRGEPIVGEPNVAKITRMIEKPTVGEAREFLRSPGVPGGKYYCFFGIHVFPPEIFDCLQHLVDHDIRVKNEIQLTSAQEVLLGRSDTYLAAQVDGERYDMGVPEGLIETQIALALHSPFRQHAMEMFHGLELA